MFLSKDIESCPQLATENLERKGDRKVVWRTAMRRSKRPHNKPLSYGRGYKDLAWDDTFFSCFPFRHVILGTGSDCLWDEASWLQGSALGSQDWVDCWRWWPPGSHTGICAPVVVRSHTVSGGVFWLVTVVHGTHVHLCLSTWNPGPGWKKSDDSRGEMRWNKIPDHTSVLPALPPEHHRREWRGHVGYRSLSRVHVEQNCSAEFRTRSNGVLKRPTLGMDSCALGFCVLNVLKLRN